LSKKPVIVMEYEIPVLIITRKIAENRRNSFFYDGQNIAVVKRGDKEYVLTTAGEYVFRYKDTVYNSERMGMRFKLKTMTDKRIKTLNDGGLIHNWGWFGINVYLEYNEFTAVFQETHDVYSNYDEAMDNFKTFIHNDIISDIIAAQAMTDDEIALLTRKYKI